MTLRRHNNLNPKHSVHNRLFVQSEALRIPKTPACDLEQAGKLRSVSLDCSIAILTSHSLTCRQRKLKCDEQKPVCSQCRKASRECRPSEGIVFRHQQNASMNGTGESTPNDSTLKGFYSYKNTFDEDSVWLEIPKQGKLSPENKPIIWLTG